MFSITPYHAKYFAWDLTRHAPEGLDHLSMSLFDAKVDLNPHQIEAALFALRSPLSKGVILADEVGLGKTIEAGLVICQYWAERKRRILVICPASIRKQWAMELEEKFNLPTVVLDAKSLRQTWHTPQDAFEQPSVIIMSFNFAYTMRSDVRAQNWDMVVIDEAHKLRNSYRTQNKMGQAIRWALEDRKKILLTATPLQNSLMELYGLSTLVDEQIFGSPEAFRARYGNGNADLAQLRHRLSAFCTRTLRRQVSEYIRYTERHALTQPFKPNDEEQDFYEAVSDFLRRKDSYALPKAQRHLTSLILRKLLASSTRAIGATLGMLLARLERLRSISQTDNAITDDPQLADRLLAGQDMESDLADSNHEIDAVADLDASAESATKESVDMVRLSNEIMLLHSLIQSAQHITEDTKSKALLTALNLGFAQMQTLGAARKAVVFTESRKTQAYLKSYLEAHGYAGQVVTFNGSNSDSESIDIYTKWLSANLDSGRASGSREIDMRTALIEHFRDHATLMVATDAAAEGINLQFCSLVVNYDLPWNPQRVEQRIGRCHRYGQQYDVVVINFLNERNEADRRVLELLTEKFKLFDGVFGASDEVLGTVESGVDFETRIFEIYQECRTSEEIDAAFCALRDELDAQIQSRLEDTRHKLLEYFDEDVHERLRLRLEDAQAQLDRMGRQFWQLTQWALANSARFYNEQLIFDLEKSPSPHIARGRYHLVRKPSDTKQPEWAYETDRFLYRISHPLGEYVIGKAKNADCPPAEIIFDVTHHPTKLSMVEALKGEAGYLALQKLVIESYEQEEYLLFSGFIDDGKPLDQETMERFFLCEGKVLGPAIISPHVQDHLAQEAERCATATINRSLERNNQHFLEECDRLDRWADDMVNAAEKALSDTKEQLKALRRQSRQAATLQEQHEIQQKIAKLERQRHRQQQEIFKVEDEIMTKRDALIDELEKRLTQKTVAEPLFTIRWVVK
ncbi:MAG TPA: SNF2-related protein [Spirochaetales bacterium]|nr:SNF2-related protein [Spirochaetales bacterium]